MIGAGAVVTRSVPAHAVVVGNPARVTGFTTTRDAKTGEGDALAVPGARVVRLREHADARGALSVGEFEGDLPFVPVRYFLVYGVREGQVRGEHAHHACHQLMVCTQGSVRVVIDDGARRDLVTLDRPNVALYVPPRIWSTQFDHSRDASLLVFASHKYDAADYMRDYDAFLAAVTP